MAYKQIRRRTQPELGQTEGATPEVSHAPEVSQIQTDRDLMTADDALALQDVMGNRATGQLIGATSLATQPRTGYLQPKPIPPQPLRPGGSPHEPAYAHLRRKPALQRASWDGSFDTNANFESQVNQQSGGGKPLPSDLRADLEPKFGADFSGVKIHADAKAAQLSQDVGAQAFTHGSDIYFNQGKYNPESSSGKHLLAHELTHTVQQGAASVKRKSLTSIQPKPFKVSSSSKIQRLVSKTDFVSLAGDASAKAKMKSSLYAQLLNALQAYQDEPLKQTEHLATVIDLAQKWSKKHMVNNKAIEQEDARKGMFIQGLLLEAIAERDGAALPAKAPTAGIEAYKRDKAEATTLKEGLKTMSGAKYKFSVLAAIEHPDYFEFSRKRLELTVADKKAHLLKMRSKEDKKLASETIKAEAAKSVVDTKYGGLDDTQKLEKIKEIQALRGQIGHAWVKLGSYDAKNKLLEEHSFGFWPLAYFPHPEIAIPGRVRYPDTTHDNDTMVQQRDHDITAEQYQKGINKATDTMKSPPEYKLIDYNCTKFAMEMAKSVGVSFPETAFLRIPFKGVVWDPNALYRDLEKDDQAYKPADKRAAMKKFYDLKLFLHNGLAAKLSEKSVMKTISVQDLVDTESDLLEIMSETDGRMEVYDSGDHEIYLIQKAEYDVVMSIVMSLKSGEMPDDKLVTQLEMMHRTEDEIRQEEAQRQEQARQEEALRQEQLLQKAAEIVMSLQRKEVELIAPLDVYDPDDMVVQDTLPEGVIVRVGYLINNLIDLDVQGFPCWVKAEEFIGAIEVQ